MTNSLYSLPVRGNPATGSKVGLLISRSNNHEIAVANGTTSTDDWKRVPAFVRVSSITVASLSPFKLYVRNAADSYSVYQIEGGKPTKVIPSRINSIVGNPALFNARPSGGINEALVLVDDADDKVDCTINVVCDSTLDQ